MSNTATITLPIHANPIATNTTVAATCQGIATSGSIVSAVTGGSSPYTFSVVSGPSHAQSFSLSGNGTYNYTPNPSFTGPSDSFTFNATDQNGCLSNTATITIPIHANPVATNTTVAAVCPGVATSGSISSSVTGGSGTYTFSVVSGPLHAQSFSLAANGTYNYTSNPSFTGSSDSFTFKATDQNGCLSNTATITIPLFANPIATNTTVAATCQGIATSGSISGSVTGGSGPYTFDVVSGPSHAQSFSLATNGTYNYTPNPSFTGPSDSFTFNAIDQNGCVSNTATITLPINASPIAANSPLQSICSGRTLTNTLAILISGGLQPYTFSIISLPTHGTLTQLSGFTANGNYSYVSATNYSGPDSFTYQVTDANGCLSNTANVLISVNANPVATNTTVTATCQGIATSGSIISAVSGGSSPYIFSLVSGPSQAQSFSLSANGTYNYTPNATFAGPSDSFSFRATDQNGCISNTATITIPILANPISSNKTISAICQGTIMQSTVGNVSGGTPPYLYTIVTGPTFGSATLVSPTSPTFNYSASGSFTGPTDSFTFQVSDSNGCISNISTVTIPINPNPLVSNKTESSICQGKSLNDNLSPLATGGSGSYTSFSIINSPINGGTVILNATSGAFTYTGRSSFTGPTDSFTFAVTDSVGCSSINGTITVPISSNPIAANGSTTIISPGGSITGTVAPFVSSGTPAYSFATVSGVTQGVLTLAPDFVSTGNFSYTANISATGFDSFTYRAMIVPVVKVM